MKFKDYYAALGLQRGATEDEIKKAYRKLAHRYHPDVSKEPDAEARFKEMAEAYQTLKDPEKRAAYDQLGTHAAEEEFRPAPEWRTQHGSEDFSFDNIDLADLLAGLGRSRANTAGARSAAFSGEDYEVNAQLSLEDAFNGTTLNLSISMLEPDAQGRPRRVPRSIKARVPRGATQGQRLRLAGQGGPGINGGPAGDLFLNVQLLPHRLFRPKGHDLQIDLPLAPWEAALGASVEVPTLGGAVTLKVPAGTSGGQALRLGGRGLPIPGGGAGDLFAIAQIVMPATLSSRERELLTELAATSKFSPRAAFQNGGI